MASGNTLVTWGAVDAIAATAVFGTRAMSVGNLPVLDFDAATDEYAIFGAVMPRHYSGGGLTCTIGWMATSAISGDVLWEAALKSVTDDADDLDTKASAAANAASAATTTNLSGEVKYTTVTFTDGADMDSVAAGEYFQFTLTRNADGAGDTMTGDAELVFIEIRET
jgi:hypothetical protein